MRFLKEQRRRVKPFAAPRQHTKIPALPLSDSSL
jgi:hypothetical protein